MMEDLKNIKVEKENWKKLSQIKLDKDFKDFNEVVSYLLSKVQKNKN